MPNIERKNEIIGTVCIETRKGALISSDDLPPDTLGYCSGCFTKGDKGIFTIENFTYMEDRIKILLSCDSVIEYGYSA